MSSIYDRIPEFKEQENRAGFYATLERAVPLVVAQWASVFTLLYAWDHEPLSVVAAVACLTASCNSMYMVVSENHPDSIAQTKQRARSSVRQRNQRVIDTILAEASNE